MTDAAYLAVKSVQLAIQYDGLKMDKILTDAMIIERHLIEASFRIGEKIQEENKNHG